jgi:hypothetical protein
MEATSNLADMVRCIARAKSHIVGFCVFRKMIRVKHLEGWGCSDCAWVFISSGPPLGNTIDEMTQNFEAKRDEEFLTHLCTTHPKKRGSPTTR